MNRHDPKFHELISRLQSGEITRPEASTIYGIHPVTLNGWITRSKLSETIPSRRGRDGSEMAPKITDPDKVNAMANAVARVLAGEISARAAAIADPRIVMNTLQHKVRQAKKRAGIPIRKNKTRYADPALAFAPAPVPTGEPTP